VVNEIFSTVPVLGKRWANMLSKMSLEQIMAIVRSNVWTNTNGQWETQHTLAVSLAEAQAGLYCRLITCLQVTNKVLDTNW
jgi:hypothetical protein